MKENSSYYVELANDLLKKNQLEEAEVAQRRAVDLSPDNLNFHNALANTLLRQNQLQEAEAIQRKIVELAPDNPNFHNALANTLLRQNQLQEAEAIQRHVLELAPEKPNFYSGLANILLKQNRLIEAEELQRRMVELAPDNPHFYNALANTLLRQKRLEEAEEVERCAVKLKQDNPNFKIILASILLRQYRFEEAATLQQQALELDSNQLNYYIELATTLTKLYKFEEAKKLIDLASVKAPNDTKISVVKDQIDTRHTTWEVSLSKFSQIAHNNLHDIDAMLSLNLDLIKSKHYSTAEAGLITAIDIHKNNDSLIKMLLHLYTLVGPGEKWFYWCNKLLKQKNNDLDIVTKYASYLIQSQLFAKAENVLLKALDVFDCEPKIWLPLILVNILIKNENKVKLLIDNVLNQKSERQDFIELQSSLLIRIGKRKILDGLDGLNYFRKAILLTPNFFGINNYLQQAEKNFDNINQNKKTTKLRLVISEKPKVALCLSGQMRGYEEVYPYLKANIIDTLKPDIFIHTWEQRGMGSISRSLPQSFVKKLPIEYSSKLTENQVFQENFPRIFQLIINDNYISSSDIKNKYNPIKYVIESDTVQNHSQVSKFGLKILNPGIALNSAKMYYKIYSSNQLKKEWEDKNNFVYDYVIRLRPDLIIQKPITYYDLSNYVSKSSKNIVTNYMTNPGISNDVHGFGDKFAASTSKNMDIYSKLFVYLPDYGCTNFIPGWKICHSEKILFQHLWYEGFDMEVVDIGAGELINNKVNIDSLIEALNKDIQNIEFVEDYLQQAIFACYTDKAMQLVEQEKFEDAIQFIEKPIVIGSHDLGIPHNNYKIVRHKIEQKK